MTMLISSFPMIAFIKMVWYDAPTFHFVLIGACVLLFLSVLLLWPLGCVRRVMRRGARRKKAALEGTQTSSSDEQGKPPLKRWGIFPLLTSWLAGVLCLLNVLFLIGLVPILSNPMNVLFGVSPLLTTLFTLAFVCAFMTVGSVVGAILAWWGRFWSVEQCVHSSLVTLAALAFTWELLYWNLLGFRA